MISKLDIIQIVVVSSYIFIHLTLIPLSNNGYLELYPGLHKYLFFFIEENY